MSGGWGAPSPPTPLPAVSIVPRGQGTCSHKGTKIGFMKHILKNSGAHVAKPPTPPYQQRQFLRTLQSRTLHRIQFLPYVELSVQLCSTCLLNVDRSAIWNQYLFCRLLRTLCWRICQHVTCYKTMLRFATHLFPAFFGLIFTSSF